MLDKATLGYPDGTVASGSGGVSRPGSVVSHGHRGGGGGHPGRGGQSGRGGSGHGGRPEGRGGVVQVLPSVVGRRSRLAHVGGTAVLVLAVVATQAAPVVSLMAAAVGMMSWNGVVIRGEGSLRRVVVGPHALTMLVMLHSAAAHVVVVAAVAPTPHVEGGRVTEVGV